MSWSTLVLTSICVLASAMSPARADDPAPGKQTAAQYDDANGKLGYYLFLPKDYGKDEAKKWPVILFLHGSGERGNGTTDLAKLKKHGPPKLVEGDSDFGFIVISPQCPLDKRWDPAQLKGLLDSELKRLKYADADRVYLTGLSMGGFGSWALAAAYPETFAAVAPICGGGDPATAEKIKQLPVWVFHGEKDDRVPIRASEAMVDALKAAGAKDVQFTRYPDAGHDSWTETYANPKLFEWFLKHKRTKA